MILCLWSMLTKTYIFFGRKAGAFNAAIQDLLKKHLSSDIRPQGTDEINRSQTNSESTL